MAEILGGSGDSQEAEGWVWDVWNRELAHHFFPPAEECTLHQFNVDELALAGITGMGPQQSAELLCEVVSHELGASHDCSGVSQRLLAWQKGDRVAAPPVLPLLAITVLAATKMGSDESTDPRDYYRPYRRLLGLGEGDGGEPPGYGAHIPGMWLALKDWVEGDPNRGGTSIREGTRPFIGYSLGQAAFRQSDLLHLHRFFRAYGFAADEEADSALVRAYLAEWSATEKSGPVARLHRLATQEELAEQSKAILMAELARWDPDQPDGTGGSGQREALRLALTLQPLSVCVVAEGPDGLAGVDNWQMHDGRKVSLHEVGEGWYETKGLTIRDIVTGLADGLELLGRGRVLPLRPAKVHAFCWDDTLGEWLSTDRIAVGVAHQLLLSPEVNAELSPFLSGEGISGTLDPTATSYFESRWLLVRGFRMDAPPKGRIPTALAPLLGGGGLPRLHLSGGLRLKERQGSYLVGGAPSLALPHSDDRTFHLNLEGYAGSEEFRVPEVKDEYPLDALDLQPGVYEVVQGQRHLRFSVSDGFPHDGGPGMGSVTIGGANGYATGFIATGGVGPQPREVLLLPAPPSDNGRAFLGSRTDQFEPIRTPQWLQADDGGPWWSVVDAPTDFTAVWVLYFRNGSFVLRQVGHGEPEAVAEPVPRWLRAFREGVLWPDADEAEHELFGRFQDVALSAPPGRATRRATEASPPQRTVRRGPPDPPISKGLDVLLRWCSERGSGSWDSLRNATAAIQRTWESPRRGWQLASQLADLGHIDIDWPKRRWSVSPPAICLLPGTGGCAVLSGSRTGHLHGRLISDPPNEVYPFVVHPADGPTAIYLKVSSTSHLEEYAARVGIPLVVDPASTLGALLPASDDCLERANPPHPDADLYRRCMATSRWLPRPPKGQEIDGLYRWEHQGLFMFRLCHGGEWWRADDDGHLWVIAHRRAPRDVLEWKPRDPNGDKPERLLVHGRIRLPQLAVRALVACSGQLPQQGGSDPGYLMYPNVARTIALHLGGKMGIEVGNAQ